VPLGHRAAGQKRGRRLAKQAGDLLLQVGHNATLAIAVRNRVGWDAGQQVSS
jgi:hypothetical protein